MENDIKSFEPFWDTWYIKDIIGEGGFGKVYRIEREEFGNVYVSALKHIRIPSSQSEVKSVISDGMDKESAERYFESLTEEIVKEIVLMSKLKGNSNIVSYEDHKVVKSKDKIEWNIFIRMELLKGLVDYIGENIITKRDVIKLGIDICRALEMCQKFNIIHRDIKPENIFVSEMGQFKLGDFGIARQIEKTEFGLSKKGTFTYIAPEVYKGEAYGSTVDIYSLGIVMYRLLNNNRVPFMPPYPKPITHTDRETALVKRMSGEVFNKPVNADGRLAEIVLKAAAYNPKERYESARDMRKALEAILYNEEERKVIYPDGDKADIKSIKYVSTETAQAEMKNVDETYTMSKTFTIIDNRSNEEVAEGNSSFYKNKKKKLLLMLGMCLGTFFLAAIALIFAFNMTNNTDKKNDENILSEHTSTYNAGITESVTEEVKIQTESVAIESSAETVTDEPIAETITIKVENDNIEEVPESKKQSESKPVQKKQSSAQQDQSTKKETFDNSSPPPQNTKQEITQTIEKPKENVSPSVPEVPKDTQKPIENPINEGNNSVPNEAPEIYIGFD